MIGRWVRLALGILFLPACVGFTRAFYEQLLAIRRVGEPELWLLLGFTVYLVLHVAFGIPSRAYVFGHELTHAAAAWVSGRDVKGIQVGKKSGSVTTDKLTGFVALAPYCIPVYALLWAGAYGAAGLFLDVQPWARWFFFGLGGTLAFHWAFTVQVLKHKQPDLEVAGPLLSLGIIYWANLSLIAAVLGLLAPGVRVDAYLGAGYRHTLATYEAIFTQLFR